MVLVPCPSHDRRSTVMFDGYIFLELKLKIRKNTWVLLDDQMDFDANIDHACRKIRTKIGIMARLKNELNYNQKLKLYIYRTIIESHLTYYSSDL